MRMCVHGCEDCEGELQYFIFMEMVRPLRPLAHTPALGAGTLGAHGAPWRGRAVLCARVRIFYWFHGRKIIFIWGCIRYKNE